MISQLCYLAPHQHGAEHDLQTIEEVISDEDDGGSARRPALTGTDGFNTGSGCWTRDRGERRVKTRGGQVETMGRHWGEMGVTGGDGKLMNKSEFQMLVLKSS